YVNMRRLSPFKRFELMLEEMQEVGALIDRLLPSLSSMAGEEPEWKLMLALLDQMRNISLQVFSFLHEAAQIAGQNQILLEKLQALWGDGSTEAHGFLRASVHAYYDWLLRRISETSNTAREATRCFTGIHARLREINSLVRAHVESEGQSQSEKLKD